MSRSVTDTSPGAGGGEGQPHYRRRKKLVDRSLQGVLLLALVVLEVVLLGIAFYYLYLQFSAIIEENLYSIHRAQRELLPSFLKEMGSVILVMSVINILALLVAHQLWTHHIHRVTEAFRQRLVRIRGLDLRSAQDASAPVHPVLTTTERWRQFEAQRLSRVGETLEQLPEPGAEGYSAEQRAFVKEQLLLCRQWLRTGSD